MKVFKTSIKEHLFSTFGITVVLGFFIFIGNRSLEFFIYLSIFVLIYKLVDFILNGVYSITVDTEGNELVITENLRFDKFSEKYPLDRCKAECKEEHVVRASFGNSLLIFCDGEIIFKQHAKHNLNGFSDDNMFAIVKAINLRSETDAEGAATM